MKGSNHLKEETDSNLDGPQDDSRGSSLIQQLIQVPSKVSESIRSFKDADRPGRIDMMGKAGLIIPTSASTLIIILILTFLWVESIPIFTDPLGGPGIIVSPTWDPNRDLYGIGIFIVGSLFCTVIAIGIAVPLGVGGAIFLSEYCPMRLRHQSK